MNSLKTYLLRLVFLVPGQSTFLQERRNRFWYVEVGFIGEAIGFGLDIAQNTCSIRWIVHFWLVVVCRITAWLQTRLESLFDAPNSFHAFFMCFSLTFVRENKARLEMEATDKLVRNWIMPFFHASILFTLWYWETALAVEWCHQKAEIDESLKLRPENFVLVAFAEKFWKQNKWVSAVTKM